MGSTTGYKDLLTTEPTVTLRYEKGHEELISNLSLCYRLIRVFGLRGASRSGVELKSVSDFCSSPKAEFQSGRIGFG